MYALKPQGMHLPCNMVLLVFTDATVSTAPVLFSEETSSSGIPSKHNVHEIEWHLYLMHMHAHYLLYMTQDYVLPTGGASHPKGAGVLG